MENLPTHQCEKKISHKIASPEEDLRMMTVYKAHRNKTAHNRTLLFGLGTFTTIGAFRPKNKTIIFEIFAHKINNKK